MTMTFGITTEGLARLREQFERERPSVTWEAYLKAYFGRQFAPLGRTVVAIRKAASEGA